MTWRRDDHLLLEDDRVVAMLRADSTEHGDRIVATMNADRLPTAGALDVLSVKLQRIKLRELEDEHRAISARIERERERLEEYDPDGGIRAALNRGEAR